MIEERKRGAPKRLEKPVHFSTILTATIRDGLFLYAGKARISVAEATRRAIFDWVCKEAQGKPEATEETAP